MKKIYFSSQARYGLGALVLFWFFLPQSVPFIGDSRRERGAFFMMLIIPLYCIIYKFHHWNDSWQSMLTINGEDLVLACWGASLLTLVFFR